MTMLISMLSVAQVTWGQYTSGAIHPDAKAGYTGHATALRKDLLQEYDKAVPPDAGSHHQRNFTMMPPRAREGAGYSTITETGTVVKVSTRFVKVKLVNLASATMEVKVWLWLEWTDKRLSWDPAQYGGIESTYFHAAAYTDKESTEIWLPDLTLFNSNTPLPQSMDQSYARARYDGSVAWWRQGSVDVMCAFTGLTAFPFDTLQCSFEVGAWGFMGWHVSYEFFEYDPWDLELATQALGQPVGSRSFLGKPCLSYTPELQQSVETTYQEFDIEELDCRPIQAYPALEYTIKLARATAYYQLIAITPAIILTVLSFAVFYTSFRMGERLGFGVSLLLAVQVNQLTLSAYLPVCAELLWLEAFLTLNMCFTAISLFQSCVVLAIAYNTRPYLLPTSLRALLGWVGRKSSAATSASEEERLCPSSIDEVHDSPEVGPEQARILQRSKLNKVLTHQSAAVMALRRMRSTVDGVISSSTDSHDDVSPFTVVEASEFLGSPREPAGTNITNPCASLSIITENEPTSQPQPCMLNKQQSVQKMLSRSHTRARGSVVDQAATQDGASQGFTSTDVQRLVFFEHLFFQLDPDADGGTSRSSLLRLSATQACTCTISIDPSAQTRVQPRVHDAHCPQASALTRHAGCCHSLHSTWT